MNSQKMELLGLSLALDNTGVCTFIYYPQTRSIIIPEKARNIYHCQEFYTDMPYSFAKDFVCLEDQPGFNAMYFKINAGIRTATFVFRNHAKTYRCHVTLTTVEKDEQGRPKEVLGIIENESTEMLRTRELNKLVEALSDDCFAVLAVDLVHNTIALKRTLAGFNYSLVEFLATQPTYQQFISFNAEHLVEASERENFLVKFAATRIRAEFRTSKAVVIRYKRFYQGEIHHLEAKFVDMSETQDGSIAVLAFRYIDEQVKKEAEYQHKLEVAAEEAKRANQAKTDFISRMSHDIRTPLNGIIGMTYLAREEQNPPRTIDCLDKIDTSSKFLLGLINDILDMTKAESGKIELHPEPYSVQEFNNYLEAVIKPLCKEKNQKFVLDEVITNELIPLADKLRCNQIFFNLLSNAVKFTPEGGTITYRVRGKLLSDRRVMIEHKISDTGIGMSEKFQQRIFEPFTQEGRDDTSRNRGSGLGLTIVKKLVDVMGGTISVESKLGKGSTFTILLMFDALPLNQVNSGVSKTEQVEDAICLRGKHVLVCEDHPLNQEIAKALLQKKGMLVEVAEDGQKGVEKFKLSLPFFYDVILMDIRMPIMNGYETTQAIRNLAREDAQKVPIIAMTADAFSEDVQQCLKVGMNDHLSKPVNPQEMYGKLAKAIGGK